MMITLAQATNNATFQPDLRRITEDDPDYQRLHATTIARLQRSIRQYAREVKRGDAGADTRFIHRHTGLIMQAYVAAHHEGQKDYWPAVSNRTVQHRFRQPDKQHVLDVMRTRKDVASVLKMAHEVKTYQRQQQTAALDESPESIQLAVPTDVPASFDNRTVLQGQIVWSGLQDGYAAAGASDSASPYAALYWNLGDAKVHCFDCPNLAFGSPYDPPWAGAGSNQLTQSPGDGQTECGAACKCSLSYEYPSGDALAQLGQAIADKWNNWIPTGYDAMGDVLTQPITPPGRGSTLTTQQKAALDKFRNASDMWDTIRRNLPAAPSLFGTDDLPTAIMPAWDTLTAGQQAAVTRIEQSIGEWLNATSVLVPPPVFLPDMGAATMKWLASVAAQIDQATPAQIQQWYATQATSNYQTYLGYWQQELQSYDASPSQIRWGYLKQIQQILLDMQQQFPDLPQDTFVLPTPQHVGRAMEPADREGTILLYNPNHDARGRFTYGSGATTTVARGQGRTIRQGGRRVRNTAQQPAQQTTSSTSGGSSAGTSADDAQRLERLARAQTDLAAAQARQQTANANWQHADAEYRAAQQHYQEESYRLRATSDNLKQAARDQIIAERATRAPVTYQKYMAAKQEYTQSEAQRAEMQRSLDYYGGHGPHQVQRDIQAEAMAQSGYQSNHNYRAYQRALQSSPRSGEYQHAQEQIDAYTALTNKTYNAQFQMNRYESQLIGNRLETSTLVTGHPDYLAQLAVANQARTVMEDAHLRLMAAESSSNSAGSEVAHLENRVQQLSGFSVSGVTYSSSAAQAAVHNVFGRDVSSNELKAAFGAHPDDHLQIENYAGHNAMYFSVNMTSADGQRTGSMTVSRDGQTISVSVGEVRNRGAASGVANDLTSSLDDMRALGVTRITAQAARAAGGRTGGYNGYYTWARLGFTGKIPDAILPAAQARFGSNVTRVEQIMQRGRDGAVWWKVNGTSFMATFDFTAGSYSMRTLDGWRAAVNRNK